MSPWAVLGVVLTNVLYTIPPSVMLPNTVGTRASLNLFVAITGRSGSGKGAALGVADEVLNLGGIEPINRQTPGSGEGISPCFVGRESRNGPVVQHTTAVSFDLPEIDALTALSDRSGSTLHAILRQMWSGERLGFAYRSLEARLPVEANTYRATMTAGVQPERAAALLDAASGGTPQRFVFVPATDPRCGIDVPTEPEPLRLAITADDWDGVSTLTVPAVAAAAVREARGAASRGEEHALDGHALLTQLKVSQALAVLVGRRLMTEDDWNRAGVVMAKSAETRRSVQAAVARVGEEKTRAAGKHDSLRTASAYEADDYRVRQNILKHLPREGCLRSALRNKINRRDRDLFDEEVGSLVAVGAVVVEGDPAWIAPVGVVS